MHVRLLPIVVMSIALAACDREATSDPNAASPAQASATRAGTQEPTATDAPPAATRTSSALPIAPDAVAYFGFSAAPFGSDEKMLRSAWNGELTTQGPEQADGCYALYPVASAQPSGRPGIGFMFERGRFVRIDVDDPALVAPGGGRIGMSTHEIASRYVQRAEVQPHKYVDGAQYLRVPDAGGSGQVLLFETDSDGRVTRWRIGTPPQIDYVEGCA